MFSCDLFVLQDWTNTGILGNLLKLHFLQEYVSCMNIKLKITLFVSLLSCQIDYSTRFLNRFVVFFFF